MDYAQQVRDAKKAKDDQEAEIHQSALNLARYQEKAQAAAASGDKEAEEFNQTLRLQEAANITRLRALLLQNAAIVAQLQAAKDSSELLCRMRAQKNLMATMVNDKKTEEACEVVEVLAEQQQLQEEIKNILTWHPDSHQELLDALSQKVEALEAAAFRLTQQAPQVQVQQLPALQQQYSGIAGALTQLQDVQTRSLRVKATLDGLARGVEGQHGAKPL